MLSSNWIKVLVFALCLSPVFLLVWRGFNGGLGANPIEFITHATGDWTLRFLAITLAVTPLRKLLRLPELVRFRRMLGLFAFFYGCLHFMTYLWLDKFLAWSEITKDVAKRPFITAGFTAFVLLIPLAVTSTAGWCRALLLARKVRYQAAGFLWGNRRPSARLSCGHQANRDLAREVIRQVAWPAAGQRNRLMLLR
jgi:sulfoxide reductase heme-binding subunit YedZ